MKKKGKVILVGAGPGDPGLLTLRGAEWLGRADMVIYDWLANAELLKLAPQAVKIFVGKKGGTQYKEQSKINRMLVRWAKKGKLVVRLKGGDPFIFGRGGEEAEFLVRHRIPFEVVPGVSAGIGAPAYAGIPLTDRRWASQVTFITGTPSKSTGFKSNRADAGANPALLQRSSTAALPHVEGVPKVGTLVFFMGVKNLPQIVRSLLTSGKSHETPVAVIEWGTHPHQRVIEGTLLNIVQKTKKEKIDSPALTVIGDVVRLRKKLAWFSAKKIGGEKKPLLGKTILVTRARQQASELVKRLEEEGAQVFEFPTIEIRPTPNPGRIDKEIGRLGRYDWVVFTSTNGVQSFFNQMKALGKDARIFSKSRIAAIGEATAKALAQQGLHADLVPKEFTSIALFKALKKKNAIRGKTFLLARADIAPPDLKLALEKEGGRVTELAAYRTQPSSGDKLELLNRLRREKIDYITFTSSSTVNYFFEALPPALRKRIRARFISIGPVTSRTLLCYGYRPHRQARRHTIEGMMNVLMNGDKTKRGLAPFGVKP